MKVYYYLLFTIAYYYQKNPSETEIFYANNSKQTFLSVVRDRIAEGTKLNWQSYGKDDKST